MRIRVPPLLAAFCAAPALAPASLAERPADVLMKRCGTVTVVGDRALAGCAGGLAVYGRGSPEPAASLTLPGGALDVVSTRRRLLVSLGPAGLALVGRDGGAGLTRQDLLELPGAAYQAARRRAGRYVVALGELGLGFVRVWSNGTLELSDVLDLRTRVVGVAAPRADRVLAAAGPAGVIELRLDQGEWVTAGRVSTTDAREIVVLPRTEQPPLAALADGSGGVALITIGEDGLRELARLSPLGLDRVRGLAVDRRDSSGAAGEADTWIATAEGTSGARLLRVGPGPRLAELRRWTGLGGSVTGAAFDGPDLLLASDRAGVIRLPIEGGQGSEAAGGGGVERGGDSPSGGAPRP